MQIDPETINILKDVTFDKDVKGPALFVVWRKVVVGMVRPVDKIPPIGRGIGAKMRKALREEYQQRLGKRPDS